MKPLQLKYYSDWLQRHNYKAVYLAFMRVAISVWLLKEVIINWSSMEILYGQSLFVVNKATLINRLPGGVSCLKHHYLWFILPYMFVILLNIFGIGRWFTALLLFLMVYVVQQMNIGIVNAGDMMARLILFYLIFANPYQYFVLVHKKPPGGHTGSNQNLVSNLAAFAIMLLLCFAYFTSGIAKLNNHLWWNGEATYYALSMERFVGTPFNQYLIQQKWFDMGTNYAVLLFELLFPILIWIKKIRKPLLIAGIIFHLCIYIFMMIYGFEIVFVLIYGLFLPNDQLLKMAHRLNPYFIPKKIIAPPITEV